jgi:hypothetical protein
MKHGLSSKDCKGRVRDATRIFPRQILALIFLAWILLEIILVSLNFNIRTWDKNDLLNQKKRIKVLTYIGYHKYFVTLKEFYL